MKGAFYMSFYETHELHRKEALRTHWFQCTYQDYLDSYPLKLKFCLLNLIDYCFYL